MTGTFSRSQTCITASPAVLHPPSVLLLLYETLLHAFLIDGDRQVNVVVVCCNDH